MNEEGVGLAEVTAVAVRLVEVEVREGVDVCEMVEESRGSELFFVVFR